MRMLFLHRGNFSGINASLIRAWRSQTPGVDIRTYDLDAAVLHSFSAKVIALLHALHQDASLFKRIRRGALRTATKQSAWYWKRMASIIKRLTSEADFDCSFWIGSFLPGAGVPGPRFVYTDNTVLANLYYPGGDARVRFWKHCVEGERKNLREATMVFTMSEHISKSLVEHYGLPPEKILRVNAGCNAPPVLNSHPRRYMRQNIVFVGLDWTRKGGPLLVNAFAKVRKKYSEATLTIVGCKPPVSGPGIEVIGPVSQKRVSEYLARASVFCMPSLREPFGIVYLEAMQAGLPVIACDLGATPDFVINGETGYRIQPDDVDMLAWRLEELLSNPERCRRMGERGRALVEDHYTWEKTQQKMWKAIQSIVSP